jgi:hypothetical protein
LFAYGIFKVIYSPFKAFKEIIKNPKYTGPLLIMILFILASIGSVYARASKIYVQQTLPSALDFNNPDPWTENCTMWESNANITCNSYDGILGYKSIQFNITNDITIWTELNNIGPINCSSTDGYKNLTFGIKWIHLKADPPQNVSLYLFSMGTTDHFYRDLTELINQTENDKWSNLTIPVGPDTERWVNNSVQTLWNNITGFGLKLVWAESDRSNLTILVDRLYFQSESFEPLIGLIGNSIAVSAFNAAIVFSIHWMLFSAVVFIVAKMLKIQAEFKMFLIIVGYALIAMAIMQVLFSILYLLIPPLRFSIDVISPTSVLQTVVLFNFYVPLLLPIWSIILSSIGVHTAFNLPLDKSAVIALIGFLPYYILFFIA